MLDPKKLAASCALLIISVGLMLGGPRPAWGNVFDNYGFGSRAIAMGGAMVGSDTQYSAVYYNPAGMAFNEKKSLNVGASFLYSMPSLEIKGAGPNPAESRNNMAFDEGISVGFSSPLGSGKIGSVTSFGLGVYLPFPFTFYILELKSFKPSVPYFLQYENRNHFTMITAAVAYKPWRKLSFAVGMDILIGCDINANMALEGDKAKVGISGPFPWDDAPTAGIQYRPTDWLSFGAAYHGKSQDKVKVTAHLDARPLLDEPIPVLLVWRDAYKPQQVEMGFGLKPLEKLTVSGALTWVDFSDYIPPIVKITLDSTSETTMAMQDVLDQLIKTYTYKFNDYWIPRLGAEYQVTEHLVARAGYFYRNSSVPAQTGATSFIDPPTHGIGAGMGITFSDPLKLISNPINIDFTYQGQFLQEVKVNKTSAADRSYTAGGSSHLISGTLAYTF
ncbi:MAG: outer membrane protein transport protein [bacterium]|nr:outer membrane protein transport protein [bacterium]